MSAEERELSLPPCGFGGWRAGYAECYTVPEVYSFTGLYVLPSIGIDQQVDAGVLVLPGQVDGLGHRTNKAAQRSTGSQPFALRRHRGRVAGKYPGLDTGLFDRVVIAAHRVAMSAQHRQLVPYLRDVAVDDIADFMASRTLAMGCGTPG